MSDIYRTQTNHTHQQAALSLPTAESRRVCRAQKVCSVHYKYTVPAHAGGFVLMACAVGGGDVQKVSQTRGAKCCLKSQWGNTYHRGIHGGQIQAIFRVWVVCRRGGKKKNFSSFCLITCCFYRIHTLPAISATAHKLGLLSCTIPSYLLVLFTI